MLHPEPTSETIEARDLRRRDASARYRKHVQELLTRREDLHGVSKLADLISDATRWAA